MRHRFGIVTLTQNEPLYNYMDGYKRQQYAGLPHVFIYNEPNDDRPKAETDLIYRSSRQHFAGSPMMIEKFVWFLKTHADTPPWNSCSHFVRANSSTFLNLPLLERAIEALPTTACYAGSINGGKFVSGTCIILSRDAAARLVDYYRWHAWRRSRTEDDLVIAKAMRKKHVSMTDIPMRLLVDGSVPSESEAQNILEHYPLIRVRNDVDRMRVDRAIWDALYRCSRPPI